MLAKIIQKIYLVNNLKTKMLIANNILVPERFLMDLKKHRAIISSCNTTIQMFIKSRKSFISQKIRAIKNITFSPQSKFAIKVNLAIFINQNFIFQLTQYATVILYYYVADATTWKIFAHNNFLHVAYILTQFNFGLVFKIQYSNYFQIINCELVMKLPAIQQG